MRVGDWAIAVGNPLGELESTFTVGVISATGRNNLRIAGGGPTYQDFMQTDASINFGNSGGPLVNLRGEVIGINSAVNPTGQGLGFAIPVNMARAVAVELIRSGTVRRGFLGIVPEELSAEDREQGRLPHDLAGVFVDSVQPDSPADAGGLRGGDVILEFDGLRVADVPEFRRIVADAGVGTEVSVRVHRDGKERELHVTLALRPDTPEPPADLPEIREEDWLRAEVEEITPEFVARHHLAQLQGLVVTRLDTSGRGAAGGVRVGDVILAVNGENVKDLWGFRSELRKAISTDVEVSLQIQRGANTLRVVIGREG
jgi:S1-C subfamily serine protease